METITIKNTWLTGLETGWGNGYVLIPEGHVLHGKHYDDIDVSVHGGLTLSSLITKELIEHWEKKNIVGLKTEYIGMWMVGFDTAHFRDNPETANQEYVEKETEELKAELILKYGA